MIDGFFLNVLIEEIRNKIVNQYVDKIYQISDREIILDFRNKEKLFISINPMGARINLSSMKFSYPYTPPMFCMMMRKYILNSKLLNIHQDDFERIINMEFDTINEMGDKVLIRLSIELMGRHSNIVIIDHNNKIIDSIKHVSKNISRVRQIIPGMQYILPPCQYKLNILTNFSEEIVDRILSYQGMLLHEAILKSIKGISTNICKHLVKTQFQNIDYYILNPMIASDYAKLKYIIEYLKNIIESKSVTPILFRDNKGNTIDFYFCDISNCFDNGCVEKYNSFSELIEYFYNTKSECNVLSNKANNLINEMKNKKEKIKNKILTYQKAKLRCQDKEIIQIYGILLKSNLHNVNRYDKSITVENFFEDNSEIRISLDEKISPSANVQKYFNKYKKLCAADKILDNLIVESENELVYIESILDSISRVIDQYELDEIILELQEQGYLKINKRGKKTSKHKEQKKVLNKISSVDNFTILIGKNNINNDFITFKYSNKNDLWFHAQKIPGSHVVVITNGKEIPITTIQQAAKLAAENSKAKYENLVPVDYTFIKNVKKFKDSKPGMVTYDNFKTILVRLGTYGHK